jgi:hypothetical protein
MVSTCPDDRENTPLPFNVENLNYWNSLSPCAVDQLLKSPDRPLRVVTIMGTSVGVCATANSTRKSKAAQEKVSCARQHFLSHRGLWQHPRDFSRPHHR